jgi:RNA polymerase sigma-70 factor (TIGR02943 family)
MYGEKDLIPVKEGIGSIDPRHWAKNHADYLYNYAFARLNDEDTCKDLVQDTFLAALEKIDKFEGRSSERTWLTAILKNKIVDVYRRKSSLKGKTQGIAGDESVDFFEADGHWKTTFRPVEFKLEETDLLLNKELNSILKKCMQKLPELWLSVFSLKHLEDATTEFICKEAKISQANFWVIIHRSKLNLRACMQKNWL